MEFTIDRGQLLAVLSHMSGVIERRNTVPILSNLLFKAEGDKLTILGTDMDMTLREVIPCAVKVSGSATAPAGTMQDIIRKLAAGSDVKVSLNTATDILTVSSGRSRFTLPTLPVEDFPDTEGREFGAEFTLDAADLRKLIDRCSFAISTEETRYYLNGIYLHSSLQPSGTVLRSVSTDGHRLSRVQLPCPAGAQNISGVIVPRKMVLELRKLIDGVTGPVSIELSEVAIRCAFGTVKITSKLIDGTFPDYERVIPSMNDKSLTVDKLAISQAADRVATITSDKSRAVKMTLNTNAITLTANSAEAGSATEEVEASYSSPPMDVGFNSRYLLDIMKHISGSNVEFKMNDSTSPVIVLDPADAASLFVLMPMRV